jgi:WD40 repeat protein
LDLSGRSLGLLNEHSHPIMNAAISPDGLRLATFDAAGKGVLWNVDEGTRIMHLPGHSGIVPIIRFSGSGKQLLTSGSDSLIHIWDLISKTETKLTFEPGVISAEWSPDESQLLVVTGDVGNALKGNVRPAGQVAPSAAFLVELRTGVKTNLKTDSIPKFGRFRPNGKHFVLLSRDKKASLWNTATGLVDTKFNPNRRDIDDFAFSPDGQDLLVMHDDELSLWDLDVGDEIVRIPTVEWSAIGHLSQETQLAWNPFSPDGQWILSAHPQLGKWPRDPLKEALNQVPRPLTDAEKQRFSVNLIAERQ